MLGLHAWLEVVGPLPGERWANERFLWYQLPREPVGQVVLLFDVAGRPVVALGSVVVATWLVARGVGRRAAVLVVVAFAGVLLNDVLKAQLGPTPLWSTKPEIGTDANFPSGHAFYAASFGGALLRLAWLRGRPDLVALAAALIALSGPARVVQGVHLPSDVLAGFALGLAWLLVAVALVGHPVRAGTRRRTPGPAARDAERPAVA
ncbi:unannotated protein [freshwater metagenome]|uniref:Unannotated protein n=1 Tax=freshwater metagenome TaxID=449393 RepID=A0A6J7IU35_9ZZZZ|nr:phosphatase PAP2 family protein [Actinomycetota bacterium]